MAYTYEDFINAATKAGMMERFDETDLQTAQKSPEYGLSLLSLMGDMDNAQTEEQRLLAGEAAKQLRTSYGTLKQETPGFVYSKQDQFDQLLDKVTNPGKFQYDPESDPVFGALRKVYLEGGDKATRDTLARASAATGGQANSFAIAAAQQAGAEYAAGLAKEIPGLYGDAFNKFLAQQSADQAALSQLATDREAERIQHQQVYQNALGLYQLLGYATPEIAKILGLPESEVKGSQPGHTPNLGEPTGGLTKEEIENRQKLLGVTVDGVWTDQLESRWKAYQQNETYQSVYSDITNAKKAGNSYEGVMEYIATTAANGLITQAQKEQLENYCKIMFAGGGSGTYRPSNVNTGKPNFEHIAVM